jgi:hypothetical protein
MATRGNPPPKSSRLGSKTPEGSREESIPTASPAAPSRRTVYRVGSFKVPVDNPEMMRGDRGDLGRRFKKHLKGLSGPRKPQTDPDDIPPPPRSAGAGPRQERPSGFSPGGLGRGPLGRGPLGRGPLGRGPLGRGPLGRRPFAGSSRPDDDDDDDDDDEVE